MASTRGAGGLRRCPTAYVMDVFDAPTGFEFVRGGGRFSLEHDGLNDVGQRGLVRVESVNVIGAVKDVGKEANNSGPRVGSGKTLARSGNPTLG